MQRVDGIAKMGKLILFIVLDAAQILFLYSGSLEISHRTMRRWLIGVAWFAKV